MRQDIIIAGVGGQGILSIARVLSIAAMRKGLCFKQAEVHGMSQRGGAVYSHVRIADGEIYSDLIPAGRADMILAIEPLEALRYVPMLRADGAMVAATGAQVNIPDYPPIEEVLSHLCRFERHVALDMDKMARAAGGVLAANMVALGAASIYLPLSMTELQEAVEVLFEAKGERIVRTNVRALRFGRTAAMAYREALQRNADPRSARGWIATLSPEHLASEEIDFGGLAFEGDETKLTGAEAHAFESLLLGAYREGRMQLYEHEVYRLIELVGAISPPRHTFVAKESSFDDDTLLAFPGERVVLKLVSAEVVHKTEFGAVKVLPKSPDLVRAAMRDMLAHFTPLVPVAGVLLVEFVEHDARGLGSELFVGIRATREFGPVVAAGLGGVQTEYLANKMLPGVAVAKAVAFDIDAEGFLELFKQTAAYDVLAGRIRGHERSVSDGELLRCFRAFISIARQFCVDRGEEGPDIGELEVNPFAFAGQHLVPLDGRGFMHPAAKASPPRPEAGLARLLEPASIALVGVSSKPGSFGGVILANILDAGFDKDRLTLIKEGMSEFEGARCVPSLGALPEAVDLLVIAVPAAAVPEIVRASNSSRKVRSAIIISGGAGEAAGSEAIGEEIVAAIAKGRARRDGGVVFVGPNCMGIRSEPGRYDTFFVPPDKLPHHQATPGQPVAIVSQSGAFVVSRLSGQAQLQPRFAISIGNQCDLTVSDFLAALAKREDIEVVGVYLEGFRDLDGIAALKAVAAATAAGKTVVFYKAGRTESGRSAAAGHTAAIAGDYDICQTAMRRAGAFVAEDFREFGQMLDMAACLSGRPAGAGRVFAVTNAGMEAVAMADTGAAFPAPSEAFGGALRAVLGRYGLEGLVSARNPLDVTPAADERAYDELVCGALGSAEVDAVIVSCVPLAPCLRTLGAALEDPLSFVALAPKWLARSAKPLVFVADGGAEYDELCFRVRAAGIPVFRSADEAARAVSRWLAFRRDSLAGR